MSHEPLNQNAASHQQVRDARKQERLNAEQHTNDWRKVLSTAEGRRIIWDLLDHFGVFKSVFEPNSRIAYNAGMQDSGHYVLAQITTAQPDALLQMMQAAQEQSK